VSRSGLQSTRGMAAITLLTSILAACDTMRPTPTPMAITSFGEATPDSRCQVVFLEGRSDTPTSFARAGFPEALRDHGIVAAMVAPDAHLGYYFKRILVQRLHQDVVLPARALGREHIWMVGVSAGGLGALAYTREHPEAVTGVLVLGPFLGDEKVLQEIAAAGGPHRWTPPAVIASDDYGRDMWRFLKRYGDGAADLPPLYLAFGEGDRLAPGARMLAELLPADHVLSIPGGHDWTTWSRLWGRFLDTGVLVADCR
jgi:pimeloyl-ACP methyl ester carboxylesterase